MHTREDETKWNGEGRWADIVAQSNARNQTVLRPRCLESNARHSTVLYALLLRCFERSYRTCFETIPRRPLQFISFDYYSSIGSLLGSNDTIFIFFHLFLAMVRPLLCRMVAKKSGVSQNVSVPWYACILAKLRANVFFSFSLFLEITVPCYYLVVSINVSSSKRNETTTFEVLTRIITSPYFKLALSKYQKSAPNNGATIPQLCYNLFVETTPLLVSMHTISTLIRAARLPSYPKYFISFVS